LEEWPADLGAPYFDGNENGVYDPDPTSGDILVFQVLIRLFGL